MMKKRCLQPFSVGTKRLVRPRLCQKESCSSRVPYPGVCEWKVALVQISDYRKGKMTDMGPNKEGGVSWGCQGLMECTDQERNWARPPGNWRAIRNRISYLFFWYPLGVSVGMVIRLCLRMSSAFSWLMVVLWIPESPSNVISGSTAKWPTLAAFPCINSSQVVRIIGH